MLEITFSMDFDELMRLRHLQLVTGKKRYVIPQDSVYQPLHQFIAQYKTTGYPFHLVDMLHAAAVKMLGLSCFHSHNETLFAAGGLYLALNRSHPDLGIESLFGDFTAGFSHQIGVAMSVMAMSQAFGIPWDELNPIPVHRKRTLDYEAPIPNMNAWLRLEAKGVTSNNSRRNAERSAYSKKLTNPSKITSSKSTFAETTAMVGVITQAARHINERSVLEIIDPVYEIDPRSRQLNNQRAGQYLHYAGVAQFAGLPNIAALFVQRAKALIQGQVYSTNFRRPNINCDITLLERFGRRLIGVQWLVGDSSENGIWFYHAVDFDRIIYIVKTGEFMSTRPYYAPSDKKQFTDFRGVESLLPDGSYFGVGSVPLAGLLLFDRNKALVEWPSLVEFE